MARSRRSSEGTSLLERLRRFRYLIVLITGGLGLGGWHLKDHPAIQQLVQQITQGAPDQPLVDANVVEKAVTAIENTAGASTDSFRDPGAFEVTVANVKIDPALISSGRARDIQVRVRKRDAQGRETIVWNSNRVDAQDAQVTPKGIGWPNDPFRAEWTPGDRFSIDVWSGKGFLFTKHFETNLGEAGEFPLRSGDHDLTLDGQSLPASNANQIVFQARRVGETDTSVQRTAAKPEPAQGDGTIVIK